MSMKRRDRRNRVLRTGESQRTDGRYAFKYIDPYGKPQYVYSWKLTPTDPVPAGKRAGPSLREKEEAIRRDLEDGIDHLGAKMTVVQLYALETTQRGNVRDGTKAGRDWFMRKLKEDPLGAMTIGNVRPCDAKAWAVRMKESGMAYQTIGHGKRALNAAFYTAVQNDFIRRNPFGFRLNEVIVDDTTPKVPLTPMQMESLLDFMRGDKVYGKYTDDLTILLGTGLRISELCGLTEKDIDFDAMAVSVDHQLLRGKKRGCYIAPPKTESGYRRIPMSQQVAEAFRRVIARNAGVKSPVIDGYTGFLFLNRKGNPRTCDSYDNMFKGLARKYDQTHEEPLPKPMTPHTLRHTFCTNMANRGMNPKALQYIMGHASITMTLNYYAHADFASAMAEMARLTG